MPRLLLNFDGFGIILNTIVLAAADRLCFTDSIERQDLLIAEQTI